MGLELLSTIIMIFMRIGLYFKTQNIHHLIIYTKPKKLTTPNRNQNSVLSLPAPHDSISGILQFCCSFCFWVGSARNVTMLSKDHYFVRILKQLKWKVCYSLETWSIASEKMIATKDWKLKLKSGRIDI